MILKYNILSLCPGQEGGGLDLSSPDASVASIAGFAVVLSLLIISLCVVILLCACYGKCKLPCKPVYRARQQENVTPLSQPRSLSRKNLIPLPSPKTVNPPSFTNRMRSPGEKQLHNSSLPPSNSFTSHVLVLGSPQQPRTKPITDSQHVNDTVRTLPASASNPHNVIHLRQLNAESFQQLTTKSGPNTGSLKVTQTQQRGSSLRRSTRRQGSDSAAPISPSHLQSLYVMPVLADIPPSESYSGESYPYQPGKTLVKNGPQEFLINHSGSGHVPPSSTRAGASNVPIPYLSNVPLQIDSPIPETGDEECSSTTFDTQEHKDNRFSSSTLAGGDQTERESSRQSYTSPPPSHSTEV